jgi:hypothetical protein
MNANEKRHIVLPTGEYNARTKINCKSLKRRLWNVQENFPNQTWKISEMDEAGRKYLVIVEVVEVGA